MNLLNAKERVSHLKQHWFVKNVATLQVGTFIGNIIQALIGVFLARLLQPTLFGIYVLAFGLAGIGAILLGAGIQDAMASVLGGAYEKKDKELVREILSFMFKITAWAGVITLLIMFLLPGIAQYLYHDYSIGLYADILVGAVMLSALFFAITTISLQARGRIKSMTSIIVIDQIIRYGFSLVLVLYGAGVFGAVTGHFLGAIVIALLSLVVFYKVSRKDDLLPSMRQLIRGSRSVKFKKYFGFTSWVAIDRNLGGLYSTLPVVLTGIYVTSSSVSFFKLAFGYVNLALSLLGPISILLNMEFPKIQVHSKEKLIYSFKKVSIYSIILSTILTIGAIIVAPIAFKILYGASFMPSVKYVFGLILYGCLFGIGVSLGPMWRAVNKVKTSILINAVILGAGVPLGLLLIKLYDIWGAVAMVTIWFTLSHFASFFYLLKYLRKTDQVS